MKRALLVGIDYYQNFGHLRGCANDAQALHPLLMRNEDATPNLDSQLLITRNDASAITRDRLLQKIQDLLAPGATFALLYFAGHGAPNNGDVALVTSDGTNTTPGISFSEVLQLINQSSVAEIVVMLDCCFSGGATTIGALGNKLANLRQGVSVLTASRDDQVAMETANGRGQFSSFLEGALDGGAADVLGQINMSGLYAYVSESFGAWEQRPTFKANIDRLHEIRRCTPRVPFRTLRNLAMWFPEAPSIFDLDPSFEPTVEPSAPEKEQVFAGLQSLRACRLVEPVDEEHMYYAAMNSTGCRLTPLGQHYWQLVKSGRI